MKKYTHIEDIIKDKVSLPYPEKSNGWIPLYCEVCGDGSKTKGPRGGWKFEGENVFYHCFNCGINGSFTPEEEYIFSKDMKKILHAYNITPKDYAGILLLHQKNKNKNKKPKSIKRTPIEFMEWPDYIEELGKSDTPIHNKAIKFLAEEKIIDYKDYPFFIGSGVTKTNNPKHKSNALVLKDRLCIPLMIDDNLVALCCRDLTGNSTKKYINIGNLKNYIYGLDSLNRSHKYIFVCEGFFDAYHLNGVAIMTNDISYEKIEILNNINKPKVVAPDKLGDFNTLADKCVKAGWGITVPKEFLQIKDVTDAVKEYGKIFTAEKYMEAVKFGNSAKIMKNFL